MDAKGLAQSLQRKVQSLTGSFHNPGDVEQAGDSPAFGFTAYGNDGAVYRVAVFEVKPGRGR